MLVGSNLTVLARDVLALLDTGANNSLVSPRLGDERQLQPPATKESIALVVASSQGMEVDQEIPRLNFRVGSCSTSARFFVAPVPYPIILGSDWLLGSRIGLRLGKAKGSKEELSF